MTRESHPSDFISSLTDAARANPLAAALIGGGALWLLVGNQRVKNMTGAMMNAAQPLADGNVSRFEPKAASLSERASFSERAMGAGDAVAEQGRSGGQSIKDGVSSTIGAVKDSVSDAVGQAGDMVRTIPNPLPAVIPQVQQGYGQAKTVLSDLLDKQPLVLGAVGLAIGAAVAGAFAVSDVENEWAGQTSDNVKAEVQARTAAIADKASGRIDDLGSEARGVAADTADRVRRVGQNAVAAARETIGSGANERH